MTKKMPKTTLQRAERGLPDCVLIDWMAIEHLSDAEKLDELRRACQLQLDLIEEGQDGTEDDDPRAIRRWLKKWGAA